MATEVLYVKFSAEGDCGNYLNYLEKSRTITQSVNYGTGENKLYYFDMKTRPISGIRMSYCGVARSRYDPPPTVASLIGTTTFTEQWYTSNGNVGYKTVAGSATEVTGYSYKHRIGYSDGSDVDSSDVTIVDGKVMKGGVVSKTFNDDDTYVYFLPSSIYVSGRTVTIPKNAAEDVNIVVTRMRKATLTYNANGGSGTLPSSVKTYGSVTLSSLLRL